MHGIKIAEVAKLRGVENLRFFVPCRPRHDFGFVSFVSSEDEPVIKECVADETRYNRKVTEGYKIVLRPLDERYAYEEFYQMDLESIMRRDPEIRMVVIGTDDIH